MGASSPWTRVCGRSTSTPSLASGPGGGLPQRAPCSDLAQHAVADGVVQTPDLDGHIGPAEVLDDGALAGDLLMDAEQLLTGRLLGRLRRLRLEGVRVVARLDPGQERIEVVRLPGDGVLLELHLLAGAQGVAAAVDQDDEAVLEVREGHRDGASNLTGGSAPAGPFGRYSDARPL